MKQSQDDKFMMTAKSVCPSDDDIDLELEINKGDSVQSKSDSSGKGAIYGEDYFVLVSESTTASTSTKTPQEAEVDISKDESPTTDTNNEQAQPIPTPNILPPTPPARSKSVKELTPVPEKARIPPPLPPKPTVGFEFVFHQVSPISRKSGKSNSCSDYFHMNLGYYFFKNILIIASCSLPPGLFKDVGRRQFRLNFL